MPNQFTKEQIFACAYVRTRMECERMGVPLTEAMLQQVASDPESLKLAEKYMAEREGKLALAEALANNVPKGADPALVARLIAVRDQMRKGMQAEAEYLARGAPANTQNDSTYAALGPDAAMLTLDMTPKGIDVFLMAFKDARTAFEESEKRMYYFVDAVMQAERNGTPKEEVANIALQGLQQTDDAEAKATKYDHYQQAANMLAESIGTPCGDFPPGEAVEVSGETLRMSFRKHNDHYHYKLMRKVSHEVHQG